MSPTATGPFRTGVTPEAVQALNAETPAEEIHYRAALKKGGAPVMRDGQPLMLAYVNARFVQDTLDTVVGPAYWQANFVDAGPEGAVRCSIGILIDGEWVWKSDVGVESTIEPAKGAHSDAFKRAAVHWGIARDLYEERDEKDEPAAPQSIRQRIGTPDPETYGDEVEDEYEERPVRAAAGQRPRPGVRRAPQRQYREDGPSADDWTCPVHDEVKVIPAGVSKRTGNKYDAFTACPVAGCDEKGPSLRR